MVEREISNLSARVRFPVPAPRQTRLRHEAQFVSDRVRLDTPLYFPLMSETSDVSISKYYIYVLFSIKDRGFYIGYTANLKERLVRHSHGEVKSTSHRRPLKLIHYEYFINEKDAKAREVFLKSGFGRSNLKKALQRTLQSYK
jgi:putative endonuclease